MSRILNYIAKYDENLTVAQLKEAIEQDEISAKEKETEEIDKVKKDFKDVYLKRIYDCNLSGKTLQVLHIKEITEPRKTTGYKTIYNYKGSRLCFGAAEINFQTMVKSPSYESFYEEELRQMKVISREEFDEYYVKNYNEIKDKLTNIVG